MTDIVDYNRQAWNKQASEGTSRWVQPVSEDLIAAARRDDWSVILTPTKSVPRNWLGKLDGAALLCLASGGGQQVPILAAAGARVTSFDNSDEQLAKDALVAKRENLAIELRQGDMADLSPFNTASFDLIFHPVSNLFAADVEVVWRECFRVLKPGGRLLSGFMNPNFFLFDHEAIEQGAPLEVRFKLPFSDIGSLSEEQLSRVRTEGRALEFSHSLDSQIGGQLSAGFTLAGFYEDWWSSSDTPLNEFMPTSMATLAIKPN